MREIIPFKKECVFKTKVSSITSISLEHDYKIMDDMIDGSFILSGDYKMTEASTITEDFFYKIPFSISITNNVIPESINLTIKDFYYELKNEEAIEINVELLLDCEEESKIYKTDNKDLELENVLEEVEDQAIDEEIKEERNDLEEIESLEIKEEEKITQKEVSSVIDSVKEKNDFVTYKIYIVRENDTYESISTKYNLSLKELLEYNEMENINIGDKVIIPYKKDE